ncbi:hypothetical protein FSP39_020083 [Pinctada imbricata]|uniref:H15 domain-containing protein n=1 Tax=Pinctada imbricata TaxID=66713 RepID=A0AA88XTH6_PINIB|nr:hypothetical protein FSP39_020083 [Pinctada imbricata]
MADAAPVQAKAKTPKKKTSAKPKKAADHPKYIVMVIAAIKALKDRKGSSGQAIKKYIVANYKVDAASSGQFVKQALRRGVAGGALKQKSGTGASGRFAVGEKAVKKPKAAKKPAAKKAKKPKTAKPKAAKKTTTKAKKPKAAKKSPKKAKAAKPKAAKPKSPKKTKAAKPKKAKTPKKKAGAKKATK